MGSLFANISGTFTKPVIIGMLFPALLFLLTFHLVVVPALPWQPKMFQDLSALDTEWKLAGFTLAGSVVTLLLYILNNPIIRLFEGYPWQHGPLGVYLAEKRRKTLEHEAALLPEIDRKREELAEEIAQAQSEHRSVPDLRLAYDLLEKGEREMIESHLFAYPIPGSVLPTRLGNVIRAFENYPWKMYRIAAVVMWPRFIARIEPAYAQAIDDAKSHFDLMLNLSFLSSLLFLTIGFLGLLFPVPFLGRDFFFLWIGKLAITAVAALLFYNAAVARAAVWGAVVRGAFDLYRRPVMAALGFTQTPATIEEERELWEAISLQYSYGDPIAADAAMIEFGSPAPPIGTRLSPPDAKLRLTRGVSRRAGRVSTLFTRIDNDGTEAQSVTLTETLADKAYVWDSARLNQKAIIPVGSNPYSFDLGEIPPGSHADLEFDVIDP